MSTICVIPARMNSFRLPGKLLKVVQGKTVLERTFAQAAQCRDFDAVYVATDDEAIANHMRALGAEVIWTSSAPRNGTERICEALQIHAPLQRAGCIVNLQGDHPCTEPSTLSAVIAALKSDPSASMSTAVTPIQTMEEFLSPQVVKCVFDSSHRALYFSRAPIPSQWKKGYVHIGIYAYRPEFLKKIPTLSRTPLQEAEDLEQLQVLENGFSIKIAIVNETPLGVDVPEDLVKLEKRLYST